MKLMNPDMPTNNTRRFRVLAEDTLELEIVADGTVGALPVGEDNQLDASELADVDVAINQTNATSDLAAIDAVSDADQGTVGDDSKVDDGVGGSSSGTSFMTWVMYIGGALLVMALVAGLCYTMMNRKDANDFEHEQQNTEMSMP